MIRLGSVFGLAVSLSVLTAAYMAIPEASLAEGQKQAALKDGCVAEQVALDEGYGVTRTETHVVCASQANEAADKKKD
ncbi:hypothetical protein [Methylocella sp.]|uniref:hypothetical protein n=1 Tax=Methylocella sp. TaxID=1978226 RepID=UPI003782E140